MSKHWESPHGTMILDCADAHMLSRALAGIDASRVCVITDPPYKQQPPLDYYDWCQGNVIIFCDPRDQPFQADNYLFWVKTASTKNYIKQPGRFVEMILVVRRGPVFNQLHWSRMTGVYDDRLFRAQHHPHEKPIGLLETLILMYSNPDQVIVDPFAGSGAVGEAAFRTGRGYYGMESDLADYASARQRLHSLCQMARSR